MTQRDLRKTTLLLAGTALAALVALAAPAAADHNRPGVTVYHDVHFSGRRQTFYDDVPRLDGSYVGNDTISSLEVDRGCRVTLYSDAYYRGTRTTFTHSVDDLRASPIGNDRVSSIRIDCSRPGYYYDDDDRPGYYGEDDERGDYGAVLYSDTGFRGRREAFDEDDRDLRNNRIGNDRVSSIRVRRGCRVVLYSDTRFRGRATELVDDIEDLRYTSVGNDRVSSIEVDCRRGGYGDRPGRGDYGRGDYGEGNRRGRGVTLYEHANYRGRSETFYGDDARLANNFIRQDGASSVRVDPGCVATLYEHDGFRGRATTLSHDDPNLRNNRVGNDRVSSIRVDCRGGRDRRD